MSKLIIANWKMNPKTHDEAVALAKAMDVKGLVITPPHIFLEAVSETIKEAVVGAQDVFWGEKGAYTGEISATELKSFGVRYVVVGHSERRRNLGETDEMVAKKVKAVINAGMIPILCVGESAEERFAYKTEEVISRELRIGLSSGSDQKLNVAIVIAYEPIWAIGTGTPDTPQDAVNVVKYIKKTLEKFQISNFKFQIIYGGSVNSDNAEEILAAKEIEGALVGGASLIPTEINKIVEIARKF